jgi:hypothetical protein
MPSRSEADHSLREHGLLPEDPIPSDRVPDTLQSSVVGIDQAPQHHASRDSRAPEPKAKRPEHVQ